ncbi:MAG: hypothetical protein IKH62_05770 [Methanobrevibacter sp.]|nr:hypothetical protein [Methanobrevibacter sp.]
MDSGNAIIIALIAIILVVAGVLFFINGHGIDSNDQNPIVNSTVQTNGSAVSNDASSGSAPSQSSGSASTPTATVSSDSAPSASSNVATSDASSSADSGASSSESTPQAGQAEGTYDPADFD